MIICYIIIGLTFLITFATLPILVWLREKNKEKYVYFNGGFSIASVVFCGLSIIALLSIIVQQQEGMISKKIYYSFIILIPFIILTIFGVLKTWLFRIEIKKKSVYIRGTFGKTRQIIYSQAKYKKKGHILLIIYYNGYKYWYLANDCITPGIDELYEKMRQV